MDNGDNRMAVGEGGFNSTLLAGPMVSRLSQPMVVLFVAIVLLSLCSCTDTRWNQKQQLNDPIMQLDASASGTVMMGHILTPREASIGGFSSGGAGGCGCN